MYRTTRSAAHLKSFKPKRLLINANNGISHQSFPTSLRRSCAPSESHQNMSLMETSKPHLTYLLPVGGSAFGVRHYFNKRPATAYLLQDSNSNGGNNNHCTNCHNCSNCNYCTDCDNCANCDNCTRCDNCSNCNDCVDCISCSNCDDCSGLTNASNETGVHR